MRKDRLGANPAACQAQCLGREGLEAADGNHLAPGPDSDGEGVGSVAQNDIRAIIEQLKGWNDVTTTNPDEGDGE